MRAYLRFASVVGVVTVSAIAVAPADRRRTAVAGRRQCRHRRRRRQRAGHRDVTATNDGTGEQKTGETAPSIPAPGEDFFSGGVAAQEATATAEGGTGRSAACAGIAGDGGTIVNIGESKCLAPGDQITGSLASLSAGALIDTALAPFPAEIDRPPGPRGRRPRPGHHGGRRGPGGRQGPVRRDGPRVGCEGDLGPVHRRSGRCPGIREHRRRRHPASPAEVRTSPCCSFRSTRRRTPTCSPT